MDEYTAYRKRRLLRNSALTAVLCLLSLMLFRQLAFASGHWALHLTFFAFPIVGSLVGFIWLDKRDPDPNPTLTQQMKDAKQAIRSERQERLRIARAERKAQNDAKRKEREQIAADNASSEKQAMTFLEQVQAAERERTISELLKLSETDPSGAERKAKRLGIDLDAERSKRLIAGVAVVGVVFGAAFQAGQEIVKEHVEKSKHS